MGKFFPEINFPTKISTAMCATVFEELESAVELLDITRKEFNPTQQQLIGRFLIACRIFGQEMLVSDGNMDALRATLGLSPVNTKSERSQSEISGVEMITNVCTDICGDLDRIGSTIQGELLTGVADVVDSIKDDYNLNTSERDSLEAVASTVRHLAQQVSALFEAQPYVLRKHQAIFLEDKANENYDQSLELPRVTAEAYMQSVKPPERKPTFRDRLQPYIPELKRLRQEGYTYAQCVDFLKENGINTYVGAVSTAMNELR